MKKTIQINIGGFLFNIEEDAYQDLSSYLNSIKAYFGQFEDSKEIIEDIESRIAEKFFEISGESKIVNKEQVQNVTSSMGTIQDFQADQDSVIDAPSVAPIEGSTNTAPKKLVRDNKRKVLGGVLAGLANHYSIDVVWVRVIFTILIIGLPPLTGQADSGLGISGIIVLAYIICWVSFPASDDLEQDKKVKKFYRNSEDKALAGVASGLSSYFGMDLALVRVLFLIAGFFGVGVITYLIIWVASPIAQSLTQKMELKGEPLTLNNIENNIKSRLNESPNAKEEGVLSKILLFPFRVIAAVFAFIGRLFNKLGPVLRVLIGVFLAFLGGVLCLATLIVTGAIFGLNTGSNLIDSGVVKMPQDFHFLLNDVPTYGGILALFAFGIPVLSMLLSGISLILNKRIVSRPISLAGLGLWLMGIFGLSALATEKALDFKENATVEEVQEFNLPGNSLYFDATDSNKSNNFFNADVEIFTHKEPNIKIVKAFTSKGKTFEEAETRAEEIQFEITQNDSVLLFNNSKYYKSLKGSKFQRVKLKVFLPENTSYKMSKTFVYSNFDYKGNRLARKLNINTRNLPSFMFKATEGKPYLCEDCPELTEFERNNSERTNSGRNGLVDLDTDGLVSKDIITEDFTGIKIENTINLTVEQGDSFSVQLFSNKEENLDEVDFNVYGKTLEIELKDKFLFRDNNEDYIVRITMPRISYLQQSGATTVKLLNFKQKGSFDIDISGASQAGIDIVTDEIEVELSGASKLVIKGEADEVDFDISGASKLDATSASYNYANVESSGASSAKMGKTKRIDKSSSGASSID